MPEDDDDLELSTRPFWSGTITFGLVSIPVSLLPATRSNRTSLRMVSPSGKPLARRYFSVNDDRMLSSNDIVRGYEIEKDHYVVVEDEELERLAPERTRDIDLKVFVKATDIDPKHFERAYYLAPAGGSTKAYRLLAKVMEETDRAGIATFVMRGKEYLIAILAENGILRAETLRFADELRTPEAIGLPEPVKPPAAAVKRMAKEIAKLEEPKLDVFQLEEKSAERLHEVVEKKLKSGKDVVHYEPEEDEEESAGVIDLMERLQRSLRGEAAAPTGDGRKKPDDLERSTKTELYERAQELDIPGRSSMTKEELIAAIRESA